MWARCPWRGYGRWSLYPLWPRLGQHLPHLAAVLPHLEVCSDQTYFVFRLQQLASQLDVVAGKNNLAHIVLLFLHRLREDRLGMLGRVNLGLSRLNLPWILD